MARDDGNEVVDRGFDENIGCGVGCRAHDLAHVMALPINQKAHGRVQGLWPDPLSRARHCVWGTCERSQVHALMHQRATGEGFLLSRLSARVKMFVPAAAPVSCC